MKAIYWNSIMACILLIGITVAQQEIPKRLQMYVIKEPLYVNTDNRLDQKVSLMSEDITVLEFLKKLMKGTGVALHADSALRRVKLFVRVKDRTLGDTLEALAEALDMAYGWGRIGWKVVRGARGNTYRLVVIKPRERRKMRLGYWEKRFRTFVRTLINMLKAPQVDLEQLFVTKPWFAIWLAPPMRKGVEVWTALTDEELQMVLEKGIIYFSAENMPKRIRVIYDEMVRGACKRLRKRPSYYKGIFFARGRYGLHISLDPPYHGGSNWPSMVGELKLFKLLIVSNSKGAVSLERYAKRWERVGKRMPLQELKRYTAKEVLKIIAKHFNIDIIGVGCGRMGRAFPKLCNATWVWEAIRGFYRDFQMQGMAHAWHFFAVAPKKALKLDVNAK